jgi:glutamate dehydrogenase/leucine dehydrogenase
MLERLKNPERVLETNLSVEMDDGSIPERPADGR